MAADSPFNLDSPLTRSALDAYQPLFGKMADGIHEVGAFSEPEQWRFDWECTYTRNVATGSRSAPTISTSGSLVRVQYPPMVFVPAGS
jgi:hypothetical protein